MLLRSAIRRSALLLMLAGSLGCSSNDATPSQQPLRDPCAQADADACLVEQKACGVTAGAPECFSCERGAYASAAGACVAIGGEAQNHAFADFTTQPGEEVLGLCQSWTLDNDAELWVNAVELVQNALSHHSNWTFVPETAFDGPDGVWKCKERNYDQLSAAVLGGVLYAQSTQAVSEVQKFPDGAAVRIPPRSRIIGDVHLLNTTTASVAGHTELAIYTIPKSEVKVPLAPFHLTYDTLAIPPKSRSRFAGTCELAGDWKASQGGDVSMSLYYALPHTHALGVRFFLEAVGGARDGELLFDVHGSPGEARGKGYTPPVVLDGITGLRFGCEFENPRDEIVEWGFEDQEMCEMLGFIDSPLGFESRIGEVVPDGVEGGMQLFTGACDNILVPWGDKQ